ncbi:NAD-dependent epimerase/dehydratase family protein [Rugamonas sp. FT82W]|uniref:NAD-dependent epimerase/dehydratase family protein n=1 Tax=Duganella vulcania TaxID=2692166 RepID=A0A845G862_9BURK|nr:NAD(P)-dependent oxidoreductase [Duganella vulcania]MYM90041.1 NAD-dependent epimerase/dehydratase family protein [Duganella vulcania]
MSAAARRALVTGASGFVGAALTRRLLADGWEVHLLLREGSSTAGLPPQGERLRLHRHDGSINQLIDIMRAAAPEAVFHLASLFLATHKPEDVERLINSNLLFSTQLAEAMAACGVRNLVNTGTSWEHYQNADYNPVCLYAATKQAFGALLRYYVEVHGLRVVTLKLFDTYGAGDTRPKVLNLLKRIALEGTSLAMSPGGQLVDLVYIDDVVEAFLMAYAQLADGTQQTPMEEYGVSSGAPLPLRELAALYAQVSGRPLDIDWGGRPYREREVMVPWHGCRGVPGWRPQVGLAQGLALFHQA